MDEGGRWHVPNVERVLAHRAEPVPSGREEVVEMSFVFVIVELASVLAKSSGFIVALGFQHETSLQQHLQIVVSVESRCK